MDGSNIMNDDLALQLATEKPFVVPSSFVYLAKAFSIIEGICVQLDPEFNYFTYLEPMIKEQFVESFNIQEIMMSTSEVPSRIRNISKAVLDLEKSKAAMRRSIKKTRREVRFAQYSILSAILAQQYEDTPVAVFFFVCTLWFTFSSQRNKL